MNRSAKPRKTAMKAKLVRPHPASSHPRVFSWIVSAITSSRDSATRVSALSITLAIHPSRLESKVSPFTQTVSTRSFSLLSPTESKFQQLNSSLALVTKLKSPERRLCRKSLKTFLCWLPLYTIQMAHSHLIALFLLISCTLPALYASDGDADPIYKYRFSISILFALIMFFIFFFHYFYYEVLAPLYWRARVMFEVSFRFQIY